MSNSNTQNLSLASRRASSSDIRVVYIGKDAQPINLAQMTSVNSHAWQKSASFESLKRTVYILAASHTVTDIISLVSNELPQDTGAAYQESQSTAQTIINKANFLGNLDPVAFLSSTDKELKVVNDPSDLSTLPDDISFIWFTFILDAGTCDPRVVKVDPLLLQFSLKLPQYIYDVTAKTTNVITKAVSSPDKSSVAKSLVGLFSSVGTTSTSSTRNKTPSTPITTTTATNMISTSTKSSTPSFSSSSMIFFSHLPTAPITLKKLLREFHVHR